jgi:hypothetical protein
VLGFLSGAFSHISSQTLSPVITYEYGYPLAIERAPGIINRFGTSGAGKSYDHTVGIGISLKSPDFFATDLGLSAQLQYRYSLGKFTSEQYLSYSAVDETGQPVASTNMFDVASKIQSLDISFPFEYHVSKMGFSLGPWGSFEISRNITGNENIISPSNAHFPGGGASHTFASGDMIASSKVHGGFEAGLSMLVPFSVALAFEPRLFSRIDLSTISDASAKSFSVGLSFSLSPIAAPPIQRLLDTPAIAAPMPKITAFVHFTKNGVRTDERTPIDVTGYSTTFHQYTEYLPELYFDDASPTIPSRYLQLEHSEAQEFTVSSLANEALSEFEKNTLSILGLRLKKDTLARIILQASFTNAENEELASERAKAVKEYLTNVWMIPAKRISVSTVQTSEKPHVTFYPSVESITAPVATQWIENSFHIPHMGIEKEFTAEAGLRSWDITVMQNGKILSHFSSNVPATEQSYADFDLLGDPAPDGKPNGGAAPVVVLLKAQDFAGQTTEVSDTLTLPSASDLEKNMIEREALNFIFLQRPSEDSEHQKMQELMMHKLLENVRIGTHVTITNPASSPPDAAAGQSIAERIVSSLKLHPELATDVHIVQRSESADPADPYDQSIFVRIEQAKSNK